MSKSTITRLFVGSLIVVAGGLVVGFTTVLVGYANGAFLMRGPDVIGVQSTGMAWSAVVLVTIGVLAIIGGAIGQFVAWIGAVLNTAQRDDKTWFLILLLLCVLSFGFLAMLMYVVAGPDGGGGGLRPRGPVLAGTDGQLAASLAASPIVPRAYGVQSQPISREGG